MNKIIKIGLAILLLGVLFHGNWAHAQASYPEVAGTVCYDAEGRWEIELFGNPPEANVSLVIVGNGTAVIRNNAATPDPRGTRKFDVEILSMELISVPGPSIHIGSSFGLPATTGSVSPTAGNDFPAESFFDVFYVIEVGGVRLVNTNPPNPPNPQKHTSDNLTEYPYNNVTHESRGPVPLFEENGDEVGQSESEFTLNPTDCTDSDNDGVPDEVDSCPGSILDEIPLNPNHSAQNIDFGPFEVGPDNDPSIPYDMTATGGCTCKQIAEKLGVGKGHLEKGCSPGLMEEWTGIPHNPDR